MPPQTQAPPRRNTVPTAVHEEKVLKPTPTTTAVTVPTPAKIVTADYFKRKGVTTDTPLAPTSGYVFFVTSAIKQEDVKDSFKLAGGTLPGFTLYEAGLHTPLKPFIAHLFKFHRLWTRKEGGSKVVTHTTNVNPGRDERADGWREHIFTVVGVRIGKSIRPATVSFRSGMVQGIANAVAQYALCERGAWNTGSEDKRIAVAASGDCPPGMFMFRTSATIEPVEKEPGKEWFKGSCNIQIASADDAALFVQHINDPAFLADFGKAEASHDAKIKRLLEGDADDSSDSAE